MKRHSNVWLKTVGGGFGLTIGVLSFPLIVLAVFSERGRLCFAVSAFACLFIFAARIIEKNARTQDKLKAQVAALNETLKEKEKREFIKINIRLSMVLLKSRLTKR